jgi:hypothetical protein
MHFVRSGGTFHLHTFLRPFAQCWGTIANYKGGYRRKMPLFTPETVFPVIPDYIMTFESETLNFASLEKSDDASLGRYVPWMMRPWDVASHG